MFANLNELNIKRIERSVGQNHNTTMLETDSHVNDYDFKLLLQKVAPQTIESRALMGGVNMTVFRLEINLQSEYEKKKCLVFFLLWMLYCIKVFLVLGSSSENLL